MAPVCVSCQVEFRNVQSGVLAVSCTKDGNPHEGCMADLWECPVCNHQIMPNINPNPVDSPTRRTGYQDFGVGLKQSGKVDLIVTGLILPRRLRRWKL